MPKVAKIAALIVAIIIMVAILAPFLIGIYLERNYHAMLAFYNSLPGIYAQESNYKRGWLSSEVTLTLNIKNVDYVEALKILGLAEQEVPRIYVIDQHIQHGPFIYGYIPFPFGLAAIHNVLRQTPDIQRYFTRLGVDRDFIQVNDAFISLTGKYFQHLKIAGINIVYPADDAHFKMGTFESRIWFTPRNRGVNGELRSDSIIIENQGDSIALADLKYQFDILPTKADLWSGTSRLTIASLSAVETGGLHAAIAGIKYDSSATVVANQFSTDRQMDVAQLFFNDKLLGSFHLQLGINNVNAQALANMFATYRVIKERGELYRSQLEQRMTDLLPTLINADSNLTINALNVLTPRGDLKVDGELKWTMNTESIPNELPDLLKAANAQLNLRISKVLADEFIHFYITSPLISDIGASLDEQTAEAVTDAIYYNMDNNSALIESLVMSGQLRDADALDLLELQKNMVPIKDYADQINQILWNKYLTLPTSYILYWGYLNVEQAINVLENEIKVSQDQVIADIQAQINSWVQQGYIIEDKDHYIITIDQDDGKIKFNNKPLSESIPRQ
jgi:uncharacterized protein YdgA (DUF945 family)